MPMEDVQTLKDALPASLYCCLHAQHKRDVGGDFALTMWAMKKRKFEKP